jgi:V8-like Glu-specific endopeptidase
MKNFLLVLGMIVLSSCGMQNEGESRLNQIIGDDDRREYRDSDRLSSVVKISVNGSVICSGYFSASNQITTAGHCIEETGTGTGISGFKVVNGLSEEFEISGVIERYNNSDTVILETKKYSDSYLGKADLDVYSEVELIGYATDLNKFVNVSGASMETHGLLLYKLDTLPGASGSPIIQDGKVVGVHIGTFGENLNLGVSVNQLESADLRDYSDYIGSEKVAVVSCAVITRACVAVQGHPATRAACAVAGAVCEKYAEDVDKHIERAIDDIRERASERRNREHFETIDRGNYEAERMGGMMSLTGNKVKE